MKNIVRLFPKLAISVMLICSQLFVYSQTCTQCSTCDVTISGVENNNVNVNSSQKLCITETGVINGTLTLGSSSTVCNKGHINGNITMQSSATLCNENLINTGTISMASSATIYNYGSLITSGNLTLSTSSYLYTKCDMQIGGNLTTSSSAIVDIYGKGTIAGYLSLGSSATLNVEKYFKITGNVTMTSNSYAYLKNGSYMECNDFTQQSNVIFYSTGGVYSQLKINGTPTSGSGSGYNGSNLDICYNNGQTPPGTKTGTITYCVNNVNPTPPTDKCSSYICTVSATGASICIGSTATITANGMDTYTWSNSATGSSISVTPTVTTTYTVTGTKTSSGCTSTAQAIVTVNSIPTVTASGATICTGATANINASGANTYTWDNSLGTGSAKTINPTTTTTYHVTGTSTAGCTSTAQAVVNVNSLPTVSVNNVTICNGATAVLTASGANTYTWSNLAIGNPINISPTITTSYTVTGTDNNGCTNSAQAVVTVNQKPNVTATGASICMWSSASISASGANTYTWDNNLGTGSAKTVEPTTTTTYNVTGTDNNGCVNTAHAIVIVTTSQKDSVTAGSGTNSGNYYPVNRMYNYNTWEGIFLQSDINKQGNISKIKFYKSETSSDDGSNITNVTVFLKHTNASTLSAGTWSADGYTQVFSGTVVIGTSAGWKTITLSTPFAYNNVDNLQITVQHGYQALTTSPVLWKFNSAQTLKSRFAFDNNSIPTNLAVTYDIPNAQFVFTTICPLYAEGGDNKAICTGGNVAIGGSPTAKGGSGTGFTYTWTPVSGLSAVDIANPTASPSVTTTYTIKVSDSYGATASDNVAVTVNSFQFSVFSDKNNICIGESATLTASGGGTYTWNNQQIGSSVSVSPSITTTYFVTGTGINGCSNTTSISITVNPLPTVTATGATILNGESVTISASGASNYTWSNFETGSSMSVNPTVNTTYFVTGTDDNGCINTVQAIVIVEPNFSDSIIYFKIKDTLFIDLNNYLSNVDMAALNAKYTIVSISRAFPDFDNDEFKKILKMKIVAITQIDFAVNDLTKLEYVVYAQKSPVYKFTQNDPHFINGDQYSLNLINAVNAWSVIPGGNTNNAVVAIVDSDFLLNHEDLQGGIFFQGYDVADNNIDVSPPPTATFYHGTHCAGIVGATTNNAIGVASISHNDNLNTRIRILPIKATTDASLIAGVNTTTAQNIYDGIAFALNEKKHPTIKVDVISMSFSSTFPDALINDLMNVAYKKNIVCVAAAGNRNANISGFPNTTYPCSFNHVICVGATDANDLRWITNTTLASNFGTYIDVMAPGANIWSTAVPIPRNLFSLYEPFDGTSMACPLVAGICGLMRVLRPGYDPNSIEACLENGCIPINNIPPNNTLPPNSLGAGRVDAFNALTCINNATPSARIIWQSSINTCVGTPQKILLELSGVPPFTVTLSNGQIFNNLYTGMEYIDIMPNLANNIFSIQGMIDGNGTVAIILGNAANFNVFDCCPNLARNGNFNNCSTAASCEFVADQTPCPTPDGDVRAIYCISPSDRGNSLYEDGPWGNPNPNPRQNPNNDPWRLWEQSNINLVPSNDFFIGFYSKGGSSCKDWPQSSNPSTQLNLRIRIIDANGIEFNSQNLIPQGEPIHPESPSCNGLTTLPGSSDEWYQNTFIWNCPANIVNPVRVAILQVDNFNGQSFDYSIDDIEIRQVNDINITHSLVNAKCNSCNGSISQTVTGNGPFTYIWDIPYDEGGSPVTTEDVQDLCPGIYTCTITGPHICQTIRTYTIGYDNMTTEDYNVYRAGDNSSNISTFFSSTEIIGRTINLEGNLTINSDIKFTNCTLNFAYNIKINILADNVLTLEGCTLRAGGGCNYMWDGIYATESMSKIEMVNCIVSDAKYAVRAENEGLYDITNSIFNNNYTSLYIGNLPIGWGSIGYYDINKRFSGNTVNAGNLLPGGIGNYSYYGAYVHNYHGAVLHAYGLVQIILYNNAFNGNFVNSIYMSDADVKIDNITITNNGGNGIRINSIPQRIDIINSNIGGTSYGIYCASFYEGLISYQKLLYIYNNTINNFDNTAIYFNTSYNYPYTVLITDNEIDQSPKNGGTGIRVMASYSSGKANIFNNHIRGYSVSTGISVDNFAVGGSTINNNIPIELYSSTQPLIGRYGGIIAHNCDHIEIKENDIYGPDYWKHWINGVEVEYSADAIVKCNSVHNVGFGLWFGGDCPGTQALCNTMEDFLVGFNLNWNPGMGPQGTQTPDAPSDNEWQGYMGEAHTRATESDGTGTPLYVRNNGGLTPPFYPTINTVMGTGLPFSINDFFSNVGVCPAGCSMLMMMANNSNKNNNDIKGNTREGISETDSIEKIIAYNKFNYTINPEENKWLNMSFLYKQLDKNKNVLDSDAQYRKVYDSLSTTSVNSVHGFYKLLSDTNVTDKQAMLNTLQTLNNGIAPTTLVDEAYKKVNSIYLETFAAGDLNLTTQQLSDLLDVANQCPYQYGKVVNEARAMLTLLDSSRVFMNDCERGTPMENKSRGGNNENNNKKLNVNEKSTNNKFKMFPNPAKDNITLEYALSAMQNGRIEFYDIIGNKIASYTINNKASSMQISTTEFQAGIYTCKIVIDNSIVRIEKLVIIK
ncbi:MAG: S8 family serine peptidase [Bacteroidales bacterium]|nr:S8 family serine peptidase [Bacteroidales bacterium]